MPPLILHNVPDDELYVGEDGVQRPYAMLFPGVDGASTSRTRRAIPETGSFGKSTRRSRSRTNTPGVKKQEDPTLAAADKIFSEFLASQATVNADSPQRKSKLTSSVTQPNLSGTSLNPPEGSVDISKRYVHKEPTEVILRGFKSTQQYAAIREYERIAGRICEDYPRDPPIEQRKYKTDLRDPAFKRKPMSAEEKSKALRFAGGEHWIKITFESAEAAEIAIESSPQTIMGHIVSAELYRGVPPTSDEEVLVNAEPRTPRGDRFPRGSFGTTPKSYTTPSLRRGADSLSPPGSNISSRTLDSATLSTATVASSSTIRPQSQPTQPQEDESNLLYCRRIPTAKRVQLLPAEQALLPQQSFTQRFLAKIPLISWLSSDIIGSQVPKNEDGEFDWAKASLYWKFIWWVDGLTGWFDVMADDKEE